MAAPDRMNCTKVNWPSATLNIIIIIFIYAKFASLPMQQITARSYFPLFVVFMPFPGALHPHDVHFDKIHFILRTAFFCRLQTHSAECMQTVKFHGEIWHRDRRKHYHRRRILCEYVIDAIEWKACQKFERIWMELRFATNDALIEIPLWRLPRWLRRL